MTHRKTLVLGGSLFLFACSGQEPQEFSSSVGTTQEQLAEAPTASDSTGPLETLRGKFLTFVVEGSGPEAGTKRYLQPDAGGAPVELQFASPPEWTAGVEVVVRGLSRDGSLQVSDYAVLAYAELGPPAPAKSRSIGFVAINVNGDGVNYPSGAASPQSFMFSTTNPGPNAGLSASEKSVVQFYSETSYSAFQFTGGVEGAAYPGSICGSSLSDWYANTGDVKAQIATKYDHYIYYNGTKQSVCSYGQGSLGTKDRPSGEIWFNGDLFDGAIPHELGHNLGLQHASSIKCAGVPLADDPLSCTTDEYGSPVDIMGNLFSGHRIVSEKWYLGWLTGCNGVRVKASGTFNLLPLENACGGGIQALQIPMPKTTRKFSTPQSDGSNAAKFYYLEYRNGTGLDTGLPKQVAVHVSDDIRPSNQSAARSVSLDMKPSTTAKDGLVAGDSYTDPAGGVTFKVDSMDATKAVVTVTLANGSGASTCIDGATLQGSGPETCSGSGAGGGVGTGGGAGSGGTGGTGGAPSTGGTGGAATGGSTTAGGAPSTGGLNATGGTPSNGGALSSGGSGGTGGSTAAGGVASTTGGANASGGPNAPGGAGGTAGLIAVGTGSTSDDGGCSCRMQTSSTGRSTGFLAALSILVFHFKRRAKRAPLVFARRGVTILSNKRFRLHW